MSWDLLIERASVHDGLGSAPRVADVAVSGERIAAVGDLDGAAGVRLQAHGLALAPGFIDVHSHDDMAVLLEPAMDFKVMQGVTTDVVGNCGAGPAPCEIAARMFRSFHPHAEFPTWKGHRGYLELLDRDPASLNVAALIGHNVLRYDAMGRAERPPSAAELRRMTAAVDEGMEAGAVGLSTGLIYEPGRYAASPEIEALAVRVARGGGLYASHMRDEAAGLLASVRETLHIGEASGAPVQISHHKACGRDNWGLVRDSLALLDEARRRGLDASADQYPYTSGSTILYALVQNGAFSSGTGGGLGRVEARDALFASVPARPEWEGRTLEQVAQELGLDVEAAARRVLKEEANTVVVVEVADEDDVRTVMRHETTMFGSDGIPATGSNPHPRLYGTFPRVLGRYARDQSVLPLAEAIHRMTGMPAAKFRLTDRGVIRPGAFADLVLFDAATVADRGTYDEPRRYPTGISHVFVNGAQVVKDGAHTGARPGRALRRGG